MAQEGRSVLQLPETGTNSATLEHTLVEATVTFRTPQDGGRAAALPNGALSGLAYRPHIVIGDPRQQQAIVDSGRMLCEEYLGVAFQEGPTRVVAGEPVRVVMVLMYWPDMAYGTVVPGATFTVREGAHIVAHGAISRRWINVGSPPR